MPYSPLMHNHPHVQSFFKSHNLSSFKPFKVITDAVVKHGHLGKPTKHILMVNSLRNLAIGFSSLFLDIFFWKQTEDIAFVLFFHMIRYIFLLCGYMIAPLIRQKLQAKRVVQASLFLRVVAYATLLFVQNDVVSYIWLIALLDGLAIGTYWIATNTLLYHSMKENERDAYYATNSSIGYVIAVFAPLAAGTILSQTLLGPGESSIQNYYILFSLIIAIMFVDMIYARKLPRLELPRLDLANLLAPLKSPMWRFVSLRAFFSGLRNGVEGPLGSIILIYLLSTELNIGFFQSIFALCSAFIAIRLSATINKNNKLYAGMVGSVLLGVARVVYITIFTVPSLIIASFIGLFANPLYSIGLASSFFDAIDYSKDKKSHYLTYLVFREIPLTLGRIVGLVALILVLDSADEFGIARTWYLALGVFPIIIYAFTKKFESMAKK